MIFIVLGLTRPEINSKSIVLVADAFYLDHQSIDYNCTGFQLFMYCRYVFVVNFLAEEE